MKVKIVRPYRLLLVTFDLFSTLPGDVRYAQADTALRSHGLLFRPVKQIRLLITSSTSQKAKGSLDQKLGKASTVIITPIKSLPAWRIHSPKNRKEWINLTKALDHHNVKIDYANIDFEGGA